MIKESLIVEVCEDDKNKRLDQFLSEELNEYTRSFMQKLIEDSMIEINGLSKIKSSYKLKGSEVITVNIPENEELNIEAEDIPLDIIYEDSHLVVINKAAGMCVHPAPGHLNGTLVNALLFHIKGLSGINGVARPGIVHRLDMDTSGLIIVAKSDEAHQKLVEMFQNKSIKKTYVALLKGKLTKKRGRIESLIGRHHVDRKKMAVVDRNGKSAITHYEVMESNELNTLVKVSIETGRTHQIRVHMDYIGHPLFNDDRYGGDKIVKGTFYSKYKKFIENCFEVMPRHALHAKTLGFIHPKTKGNLFFENEIPSDFKALIEKWRNYSKSVLID